MPSYDYRCPANGQVVEVKHSMQVKLHTWGELCAQTGIALGSTPVDAPVERLISGGSLVSKSNLGSEPPCASGTCCGGGGCGFN
jgi:hypothetical protein